jgi:hypothetical protein
VFGLRTGAQGAPDPPSAAVTILACRMLNQWLGTTYTLDEVAEMDPLLMDMISVIGQGIKPRLPPKDKKAKHGRNP